MIERSIGSGCHRGSDVMSPWFRILQNNPFLNGTMDGLAAAIDIDARMFFNISTWRLPLLPHPPMPS